MDWFSLIPAALSGLGGLFGGGNKSTTKTTLTPQMEKLAKEALTKATSIWNKPYTPYTGQRVAGPTQSRQQLTPLMSQMGGMVTNGMNRAGNVQNQVMDIMDRGPVSVSAPTLVPRRQAAPPQPMGY